MPDLEDRLRRALREHAGDAPSAQDLAPAARARLRARRTARAVVAAVAVLVVAVPVGVQALAGRDPHAAPPVTAPAVKRPPIDGFSPAPVGWRWETGNGLQALVPDSWGYGVDLTSACNRNVDPGVPGAVEVPGVHTLVGCTAPEPRSHYLPLLAFADLTQQGVVTGRAGRWTTVVRQVGTGSVTVRDDDPVELRRILRSVAVVHRADHNGCPVAAPVRLRPSTEAGTAGERADVVSVCRYGSSDRPDARLSFSTALTPDRAAAVMSALRSAPRAPAPLECRSGALPGGTSPVLLMLRARFPAGWQDYRVRVDACTPHPEVDDGTTWRQLPREAGRAVLIGYREGLPDRLARQVGNWARDNHR